METTVFFKNLTAREEKEFTDYLSQKLLSITNLLGKFAQDAVILKASIEKFNKHDAYEVELLLTLPMKSIIAKEVSHSINKATDLCKDRLLAQIKKQMAQLRKDRQHESIRREADESKVQNMPNYSL